MLQKMNIKVSGINFLSTKLGKQNILKMLNLFCYVFFDRKEIRLSEDLRKNIIWQRKLRRVKFKWRRIYRIASFLINVFNFNFLTNLFIPILLTPITPYYLIIIPESFILVWNSMTFWANKQINHPMKRNN